MSTRALVGNPAGKDANPAEDIPSPRWAERIRALKNIPPVMKYVWDAAPGVAVANLTSRVVAALIPLTMLAVTRMILAAIYGVERQSHAVTTLFLGAGDAGIRAGRDRGMLMRVIDSCEHHAGRTIYEDILACG